MCMYLSLFFFKDCSLKKKSLVTEVRDIMFFEGNIVAKYVRAETAPLSVVALPPIPPAPRDAQNLEGYGSNKSSSTHWGGQILL